MLGIGNRRFLVLVLICWTTLLVWELFFVGLVIYVHITDFRTEAVYLIFSAFMLLGLILSPWILRFTWRKLMYYVRCYMEDNNEHYLQYFDPNLKHSLIIPAVKHIAINYTLGLFGSIFVLGAIFGFFVWLFDFAVVPLLIRMQDEMSSNLLFFLQSVFILFSNLLIFGSMFIRAFWEVLSGFVALYQQEMGEQ